MLGFARKIVFLRENGGSVALIVFLHVFHTLCALELVHQSDVLYCSVWQCYGSFYVLRYFVHWNWRMTAMRFTVVCCNSIVFLKSVSEDRNGMAAPTCLDRYLVSSSVLRLYFVLQIVLGRSHWTCFTMDVN